MSRPTNLAELAGVAGVLKTVKQADLRQFSGGFCSRARTHCSRHHRLRQHGDSGDQLSRAAGPSTTCRSWVEGAGRKPADATVGPSFSIRRFTSWSWPTPPGARRSLTSRSPVPARFYLQELPPTEVPIAWVAREASLCRGHAAGTGVRRRDWRNRSGQLAGGEQGHVGRGVASLRLDLRGRTGAFSR